jgi:formylglycine-generating enzyme required for sulfatase activity
VVSGGEFAGPSASKTPGIKFTTGGYSGDAEVYYAVVAGNAPAPGYGAYTANSLGTVGIGEHTGTVTVTTGGGDYDIYVIAYKEGKVSVPVKINTKSGDTEVGHEWGTEAFVAVEGGTFQMGDASSSYSSEKPVHSVTVSSFYMSKHEVTQAEWAAVMGSNPSHFQGGNLSSYQDGLSEEQKGKLPVEYVTWYDVVAYCNALSEAEGLTAAYTINGTDVTWNKTATGYRLPTEAEWEYAARGGKNKESYLYSGGNDADTVGWYYDNSGSDYTHPVGQKAANSLGLYDMSGNVLEWCWDRYGSYGSEAQIDPAGVSSGTNRVIRGGSWKHSATSVRSANRDFTTPSLRTYNLGFRLVRP